MFCKTSKSLRFVFAACIVLALITVSAFAQSANAGPSLPKVELLGPENLS
jgi:hypothetical protein